MTRIEKYIRIRATPEEIEPLAETIRRLDEGNTAELNPTPEDPTLCILVASVSIGSDQDTDLAVSHFTGRRSRGRLRSGLSERL